MRGFTFDHRERHRFQLALHASPLRIATLKRVASESVGLPDAVFAKKPRPEMTIRCCFRVTPRGASVPSPEDLNMPAPRPPKKKNSPRRAGSEAQAARALAGAVKERAVTFVLGAGVSRPRGVPDWRELTRQLWSGLLGPEQVPLWLRDGREALERARVWATQNESAELASRLAFDAPHPLADQLAIELLRREVNDDERFVEQLRASLYPRPAAPASAEDTLGVLARLLAAEQSRAQRRVLRVITFNADDHLETEANRGHNARRDPVLWPVSRESGHPRMSRGANDAAPIPVYHVHGFLPRDGKLRPWRDAPDTLVFADAEYWASVASPLTFANRVMAQALHDSTCIFIGLSMTDMNLMRWLGTRYNAIRDDVLAQHAAQESNGGEARVRDALLRHFWVRTAQADTHGLISALLLERGVRAVPLEAWGEPFQRLMRESFGASPSKIARGDSRGSRPV
jgi:hypothetical protein